MKKIYLIFIATVLMGCNSSDDTVKEWYDDVHFEHPAMKKCLIGWVEEYGWSSIEEVTMLGCSRNGIDSVAGIEQFENLKTLYLTYTALTELDLSGNPSLENIDIANNPYLKSVDISQNLELNTVYINYNTALEEVNLSNLPKLNIVFLTSNLISNINLEGTDVTYLNVSDNVIEHINLTNSRSIRGITLNNNPLNDIDISQLHDLEKLIINDTGINSVDVSYNLEIEVLAAMGNNIEYIRFDNNPKLRSVNIENNPLNKDTLDYLATIDWLEVLRY